MLMLSIKYSRLVLVLFSLGSLVKRMAVITIKMSLHTSVSTTQTCIEAHLSNDSRFYEIDD